ncbi:transforming growth factor-beta-induced protein ig-h3 [Patella vulgata]|uniref:transforming growth factor-beta-induced protein ig-h3 n=1 Tax=Patella vulgata TaxID=6465 RepID=UPI0021800230|nr:transforming growth factor-beta-induced protein ig-h3 [Patella vulgata]
MLKFLLAATFLLNGAFGANKLNLVEYLSQNQQYSTLVSLVKEAGLVDTLTNIRFATLFAPTNAAFAKVPASVLAELKNDTQALTNVLLNHLTNFTIVSPAIQNNERVANLIGGNLIFNVGPSDSVTVNGVAISDTDAIVSNGVIHTIDGVLLPADGDILNYLAQHDDEFADLFAAIIVANLEDALRAGVFTLFAPNDKAFAGVLPQLPGTNIQDILKYHVVVGNIYSSALSDGQKVTTLNGKDITVSIKNNVVKINGATVLTADINTNNGVIHVIDTVLVPSS